MAETPRTPPPWPEQPRPRPGRRERSVWEVLAWTIAIPLLLGGFAYIGLILLLASTHFNTVGGNK